LFDTSLLALSFFEVVIGVVVVAVIATGVVVDFNVGGRIVVV